MTFKEEYEKGQGNWLVMDISWKVAKPLGMVLRKDTYIQFCDSFEKLLIEWLGDKDVEYSFSLGLTLESDILTFVAIIGYLGDNGMKCEKAVKLELIPTY